uniref:Uncharacterized protein n=1 Tax=Lactuca sativa TaxID=4236 RepID=A0A9R1UUX9_LACSA|nr:hypothetical protein LSAT_V11C800406270 [Lactuca sativa]
MEKKEILPCFPQNFIMMDIIMCELGYINPFVIYYHFKYPQTSLDFGPRALGKDDDVLDLAQYIMITSLKVIMVSLNMGLQNW